jgi:hypothetical protein
VMTEELCSTLLFPAPMFPKAEGVLNTCQKSVRRQEGRGWKKWEEKKNLHVSQAGQSLGQYSNLQPTRYEIWVLTIKLMQAFVTRVKINSCTQ